MLSGYVFTQTTSMSCNSKTVFFILFYFQFLLYCCKFCVFVFLCFKSVAEFFLFASKFTHWKCVAKREM